MKKIRVALHRFAHDSSLPQRDGVNLAHLEINSLLESPSAEGLQVEFHDFDRVVRDDAHAREVLAGVDCVLANVGPHAHYYHELRDRLALRFRIVRDIRTALWSCYLLQEALCEPYLREGDVLLALSNYSRSLTRRLFPHLEAHPVCVFEPLMVGASPRPRKPAPQGVVTLGHVGRLSRDKNFPQMVDLLVELDAHEPGRYRLVACGAVHSPDCEPALVAEDIRARTGRAGLFTYIPPLPHEEVLELFDRFDWFLFFSTSNIETLGRVVLEANYRGVPVLAADHAATAELLAPSSLLPVEYHGEVFHSHFDAPLGRVDIARAADIIRQRRMPSAPPVAKVNRLSVLLEAIAGRAKPENEPLQAGARGFIERLRWSDLPRYRGVAQARPVIGELREWFCALNGKRSSRFDERLRELERRSRFPERTRRFVGASQHTLCDFTNLGGFDMELCNIAGFHPRFWLEPRG
ncbi:MAG TPA: glycosyltransferase [Ramlibacter sp.]|uniref:glycosyltransferase n=1 Tax=Ramlibacter sp. TaxID=1917967 RepID=UPI002CE2B1A0|nr:glycosyltransferase [Ramlibacter sp.]HVZ45091.1 glycosyltransferase [Ramlibacter sp.]